MDFNKEYSATSTQQLYKLVTDSTTKELIRKKTFPVTLVQTTYDSKSGERLDTLLYRNNCVFITYTANVETTRLTVPADMRRKGLIVTYKDLLGYTWTQRYKEETVTDDYWKNSNNWEAWDFDSLLSDVEGVVEDIFSNIEDYPELNTYIKNYLTTVGGFNTQVVTSLPSTGINGTIYLILDPTSTETTNKYNEYIWIESATKFEQLGSFSVNVDLSDYVTKEDFEELQSEVAELLFSKINPYLQITASTPVELPFTANSASVTATIAVKVSSGNISDLTDTTVSYTADGSSSTFTGTSKSVTITSTTTGNKTITAQGTTKYKGVTGNLNSVSKTISFCRRSYIGYVAASSVEEAASSWSTTSASTSWVKASPAGTYSNIVASEAAYLVVAIPIDSNAGKVTSITQKGTVMNATQSFTTTTDSTGKYTLYICNTKHNAGTYTFILA